MPTNNLDQDYLPISPATVQPGEPVASSGGILSYVENPESFFQMLKKQISAMQYRADVSYDLGDTVWDGDIVNPRLLASRTNLNIGNALPIPPSLENANWQVTDVDIGLTSYLKQFNGSVRASTVEGRDDAVPRRDTYATTTLGGTMKARLAGTDLFITTNGNNP